MHMREILKPLLDSVSALMTQLKAALSIPLADASQLGESENAAADGTASWEGRPPNGVLFDCVDEHSGRNMRNGLGSLEIGATRHD